MAYPIIMTIQEAIAEADDATCRATLEYILTEFASPAFGAIPKKEIELLMLEALVQIGYLDSEPSLYHLIQLLRVSRSKSRSLVYERDLRRLGKTQLDELPRRSLVSPHILKQGDLFCLEIENPLVVDHLKDKLQQLGFATDGSFSPSLVRLSRDAFNALIVDCVPSGNQMAVRAALVAAGAPDGTFGGVIKGVLVKLGGKFADSAGEEIAGNISEYLEPILSGATSEITSRVSELFRDTA
jgi:hypothetical protein